MNMKEEALELAVWLENMSKLGWADNFGQELDEISAMIRRLVEELDEKNYRILELTKRYKALTWNDKQGEPFAWSCWNDDMPSAIITYREPDKYEWMSIKPLYTTPQTKQGEPVVYWDGKHFASKEKSNLADIPLYTTPQTKPLSDDEIKEVEQQVDKQYAEELIYRQDEWVYLLVRAIEERHGIK